MLQVSKILPKVILPRIFGHMHTGTGSAGVNSPASAEGPQRIQKAWQELTHPRVVSCTCNPQLAGSGGEDLTCEYLPHAIFTHAHFFRPEGAQSRSLEIRSRYDGRG